MSGVVRVEWGKEGRVEEIDLAGGEGEGDGDDAKEVDWESSVVVYGIVGVLELTFGVSHPPPH
jgi:hypothetical protein